MEQEIYFFGDGGNNGIGYIRYDHNSNFLKFNVNGSEKFRINSGGNVGIGTNDPGQVLHISGTGQNTIRVDSSGQAISFYNHTEFIGYIGNESGKLFINAGGTEDTLLLKTNGSERLRITSDGFIGINEDDPKTGLTIAKLGDYSTDDGNTYYMPVGKWSSAWNGINAIDNSTDYWVGFVGGYLKSSSSVNISLAPNRGNASQQAGMYISGEATSNSSADFAIGKIMGGSSTGSGTSGNVRATKSELVRITSDGEVGIGTDNPTFELDLRTTGQADLLIGSYNAGGARLMLDGDSNGDGSGGDFCEIVADTGGDLTINARNPASDAEIIFKTGGGTERARIKSDGKLL